MKARPKSKGSSFPDTSAANAVKLDLFDYSLPDELIAAHPPDKRDGGRLLVLNPQSGQVEHRHIADLAQCLLPGSLLVANNTRVIRARLRGRRPTGGAVEVLLVRELVTGDDHCRWIVLTRANKPMREGDQIHLEDITGVVREKRDQGEAVIECDVASKTLLGYAAAHGEIPLPPYIRRDPVPSDAARYQTIFAAQDGSVAAPTAGLHFTPELIARLKARDIEIAFVTLHVGPGTFRPIAVDDTDDHEMDAEAFDIGQETVAAICKAKTEGRRVIAIGTTVTRALEGAYAENSALQTGAGTTDLFIAPGFEFKVIDGLLTNFHLPRSTLLCLVAALAGRERILAAYQEAVTHRYRFYSYGDAMLILPE
ncbi:MAG: tRNA preQ1(34) S-adenosylmethionine ribosyltransferase-isomerase QueA [Myxococcota bacterium]|nr:tRNA preQ1(34) S-adenosylmethionine ribosyltransferase-isomerase QueA [Myxococcota bacterium]